MKILVTGGLGFIGSHLVDLLISNGLREGFPHEISVLDDKSSNTINEADISPSCKIILGSLNEVDPTVFEGFDVIFHLASVVGPAGVLTHGAICSSIIENTGRYFNFRSLWSFWRS